MVKHRWLPSSGDYAVTYGCRRLWLPPPSVLAPCYGVTFLIHFISSSSSGVTVSVTTLIDIGCSTAPPFNTGVHIWQHTILAVTWPLLLHLFHGCYAMHSMWRYAMVRDPMGSRPHRVRDPMGSATPCGPRSHGVRDSMGSATPWGPRPHGVRDPMESATPWGPRPHGSFPGHL